MSNRWVVNASPLILLGKVDQTSLLLDLVEEIIIPEGVAQEVQMKPDGEHLLKGLVSSPDLRIEKTGPIQGISRCGISALGSPKSWPKEWTWTDAVW